MNVLKKRINNSIDIPYINNYSQVILYIMIFIKINRIRMQEFIMS